MKLVVELDKKLRAKVDALKQDILASLLGIPAKIEAAAAGQAVAALKIAKGKTLKYKFNLDKMVTNALNAAGIAAFAPRAAESENDEVLTINDRLVRIAGDVSISIQPRLAERGVLSRYIPVDVFAPNGDVIDRMFVESQHGLLLGLDPELSYAQIERRLRSPTGAVPAARARRIQPLLLTPQPTEHVSFGELDGGELLRLWCGELMNKGLQGPILLSDNRRYVAYVDAIKHKAYSIDSDIFKRGYNVDKGEAVATVNMRAGEHSKEVDVTFVTVRTGISLPARVTFERTSDDALTVVVSARFTDATAASALTRIEARVDATHRYDNGGEIESTDYTVTLVALDDGSRVFNVYPSDVISEVGKLYKTDSGDTDAYTGTVLFYPIFNFSQTRSDFVIETVEKTRTVVRVLQLLPDNHDGITPVNTHHYFYRTLHSHNAELRGPRGNSITLGEKLFSEDERTNISEYNYASSVFTSPGPFRYLSENGAIETTVEVENPYPVLPAGESMSVQDRYVDENDIRPDVRHLFYYTVNVTTKYRWRIVLTGPQFTIDPLPDPWYGYCYYKYGFYEGQYHAYYRSRVDPTSAEARNIGASFGDPWGDGGCRRLDRYIVRRLDGDDSQLKRDFMYTTWALSAAGSLVEMGSERRVPLFGGEKRFVHAIINEDAPQPEIVRTYAARRHPYPLVLAGESVVTAGDESFQAIQTRERYYVGPMTLTLEEHREAVIQAIERTIANIAARWRGEPIPYPSSHHPLFGLDYKTVQYDGTGYYRLIVARVLVAARSVYNSTLLALSGDLWVGCTLATEEHRSSRGVRAYTDTPRDDSRITYYLLDTNSEVVFCGYYSASTNSLDAYGAIPAGSPLSSAGYITSQRAAEGATLVVWLASRSAAPTYRHALYTLSTARRAPSEEKYMELHRLDLDSIRTASEEALEQVNVAADGIKNTPTLGDIMSVDPTPDGDATSIIQRCSFIPRTFIDPIQRNFWAERKEAVKAAANTVFSALESYTHRREAIDGSFGGMTAENREQFYAEACVSLSNALEECLRECVNATAVVRHNALRLGWWGIATMPDESEYI